MNKMKDITQYLEYMERFYQYHTHLLEQDYHKGKYDTIIKLLECIKGYKYTKIEPIQSLDCLKGGQ